MAVERQRLVPFTASGEQIGARRERIDLSIQFGQFLPPGVELRLDCPLPRHAKALLAAQLSFQRRFLVLEFIQQQRFQARTVGQQLIALDYGQRLSSDNGLPVDDQQPG